MAERWFEAAYNNNSATLRLHVYTVDKSIEGNWTKERADLYLRVNAKWGYYNNYGTTAYIGINGNDTTRTVTFDTRYANVGDHLLLIGTWDTTVWHDNNGNATIGVGCSHDTGVGLGTASGNSDNGWSWHDGGAGGNWYQCDSIPRYANFTQHYVSNVTLNSVKVYWATDAARDWTWYSKNGAEYVNAGDTVASDNRSGNYTIYNLTPNTYYTVRTKIKRADSQKTSESGVASFTTTDIARIKTVTGDIIGGDTVVKYSNASGERTEIGLFTKSDVPIANYRECTGLTYTFRFTGQEINNMYQLAENTLSLDLVLKLKTIYGNSTYIDSKDITYKINQDINKPTFTDFDIKDINEKVLYLTGGNGVILNYSDLEIEIKSTQKAIAKNNAKMVKYRIVLGAKQVEKDYSQYNSVKTTINSIASNSITVYAIDSRGLQTGVTKTLNVYNYLRPTITNLSFDRENGIGEKVYFYINGNFSTPDFPYHKNAAKVSFKYKKKTDSEYEVDWLDITEFNGLNVDQNKGTVVNAEYSNNFIPDEIEGVPYDGIEKAYNEYTDEIYNDFPIRTFNPNKYLEFETGIEYDIQFKITDYLSEITSKQTLSSGIPCTAKVKNDDNKYSIGINKFPDEQYALDVDGDIAMNGVNTNEIVLKNNGKMSRTEIYSNCFAYYRQTVSASNTAKGVFYTRTNITGSFTIKGIVANAGEETEFETSFDFDGNNTTNAICKIQNSNVIKKILIANYNGRFSIIVEKTDDNESWNNLYFCINKIYHKSDNIDISEYNTNTFNFMLATSFTMPYVECVQKAWATIPPVCIGSQMLVESVSGNGAAAKTNMLGAYDYGLFDKLTEGVTVPTGYHIEYKITFQGTTGGDTYIYIWLNNISTEGCSTWSGNTFRILASSQMFEKEDIILETTYNYAREGTNLKYEVTGNSAWEFRYVTIHAYLVSDE